ncbi:hypothetical protein CI109_103795 [Kwoniella shandongensis]|uniref:Uncharacterized protein n=1 Tax=Kwoniella shandongensis TaxID=1734106 RepID=A0AAJ8LIW3_9TREE
MSLVKPAHFVAVPQGMWGHVRPLLQVSLNLLQLHPHIHLTFLLSPSILPRIQQELKAYQSSRAILDRIQLIQCVSKDFHLPEIYDPAAMHLEAVNYAATLPAFIHLLYGDEHEYSVKGVENKWKGIEPDVVLFDIFQHFVPGAIKGVLSALNKPLPKMLAFVPSNAAAAYHCFVKEEDGGMFARVIRLADEAVKEGMDPVEAYTKYAFYTDGSTVTVPGSPTKFDFPLFGTIFFPPGAFASMAPSHFTAYDDAVTAFVITCNEEFEPVTVKAAEEKFGKKVYTVGPQFTAETWNGAKPSMFGESDDDKRVLAFMDKMKEKHGLKSVAYISFGSLFFPVRRTELIRYILHSLRANDIPFVFAYASGMAKVPDDLVAEFKDDEDSCMVKFAPQIQILNHDALSFFVTHCGSNSIAEAMVAEVPIVAMPFAADQGQSAAIWIENHRVGIQLKQVMTFVNPEHKKLHDGTEIIGTEEAITAEMKDVFKRMKGPEGEELRERMQSLRRVAQESWKDGKARRDMEAIGTFFQ